MEDFDEKLKEINAKLKAALTGVSIARRKNNLELRATLPPKPHINKTKPYQQEVTLGLKANHAGLQSAVIQAKKLGLQLQTNNFNWSDWIKVAPDTSASAGTWLEKFEENHWTEVAQTDASLTTWQKDYQAVFKRLGQTENLTTEYLLKIARTTEPDTRTRKKVCTYLHKLGVFASCEGIGAIKKLAGNYSQSSVNPRNLPSDKLISQYRDAIANEAWQWVFGIMACYGVRSHEVFHLDVADFPVVRVLHGKTGERFIYPLYPEWAEKWQLDNIKLPNIGSYANAKLGTKVARWFRDSHLPIKAYDLRHSYARRCFQFTLPPDWAAGLMGHSLDVHLNTYRAWIDEATYRKAYELVINRADRPLAP